MTHTMTKLTQGAILAELAKLKDNAGKKMLFADGQTIVPNSLLEQVWLEAERRERKRIIDHLNQKDRGKTHSTAMRCMYCEMIIWLEEEGK